MNKIILPLNVDRDKAIESLKNILINYNEDINMNNRLKEQRDNYMSMCTSDINNTIKYFDEIKTKTKFYSDKLVKWNGKRIQLERYLVKLYYDKISAKILAEHTLEQRSYTSNIPQEYIKVQNIMENAIIFDIKYPWRYMYGEYDWFYATLVLSKEEIEMSRIEFNNMCERLRQSIINKKLEDDKIKEQNLEDARNRLEYEKYLELKNKYENKL